MKKTLIYIVAYRAQEHIVPLLSRIPSHYLHNEQVTIYVSDDASTDDTVSVVQAYADQHQLPLIIQTNPTNLGYGGNQKVGYAYAAAHGFEVVVLLHGDGQYAPEYLDAVISPIDQGTADVVLGSRMMSRAGALNGGMPLYKWLGNIFLTTAQNILLKTQLHEFHTGYRAFRVSSLQKIPLERNSDGFVFDTEILIQLIDQQQRISEVEVPTFYGDEISHVKCVEYGFQVLGRSIAYRLHKWGWLRCSRFDCVES